LTPLVQEAKFRLRWFPSAMGKKRYSREVGEKRVQLPCTLKAEALPIYRKRRRQIAEDHPSLYVIWARLILHYSSLASYLLQVHVGFHFHGYCPGSTHSLFMFLNIPQLTIKQTLNAIPCLVIT
jgi:hypothetical protein